MPGEGKGPGTPGAMTQEEVRKMRTEAMGLTWKEIARELTDEFVSYGCPFTRKQLPEIAMGYDCTPLFFWNWLDGEEERSEKGFLRVLGYAWRKYMDEEADSDRKPAKAAVIPVKAPAGKAA